jgi:hypothetical protein
VGVAGEDGVGDPAGLSEPVVQRVGERQVGAVRHVGGIDGLMHGQDHGRVGGRVCQLADRPRDLVGRELAALRDVALAPDHPQPVVNERPVDVGLLGHRTWDRVEAQDPIASDLGGAIRTDDVGHMTPVRRWRQWLG